MNKLKMTIVMMIGIFFMVGMLGTDRKSVV